METPRVRLGELLVKSSLLTQEQLDEALELQKRDGRRLGTLLVEAGFVNETQVTQVLSQQLSVPWVSLHHIDFSRALLNLVPPEAADRYCLVPIYVRRVRGLGEALYVAMDDPTNARALEEVAQHSGLHVRPMIAPPSDIRAAIRAYYGVGPEPQRPGPDRTDEAPGSGRNAGDEDEEETTAVRSRREILDGDGSQGPEGQQPARVPPSGESEVVPASSDTVAAVEVGAADAVSASPVMGPDSNEAGGTGGAGEAAGEEPAPSSGRVPARDANMPRPSGGGAAKLLSLTLLDGTTITLPARSPGGGAGSSGPTATAAEDQLTTRDLIAALRAVARGADATEILGEDVRWESLLAAVLSVLLKKHLITDWEFIEEYKKG